MNFTLKLDQQNSILSIVGFWSKKTKNYLHSHINRTNIFPDPSCTLVGRVLVNLKMKKNKQVETFI